MAETTEHQSSLAALLPDFERHLKQHSAKRTVENYMRIARRFVAFVGNEPVQRISEDIVAEFFKDIGASSHYKKNAGMVIGHLLRFALLRLPVPAGKRGPTVPAPDPVQDAREIALRQHWNFDRLLEEKERGDDVIAMLGRQLVNHYVFFQSRLAGTPENIDELIRLADECREVIERNLPLFMKLSALGKNLGRLINERIIR
jgi:hypothetical protein